jgi:hypothetical protein
MDFAIAVCRPSCRDNAVTGSVTKEKLKEKKALYES